jgi:hypothetical protein
LGVLVSKNVTRHSRELVAVFILALVILPTIVGQASHSPGAHTQERFARAADTTYQQGVHAKLPPHLSTLLGLSNEEECPVMQSVVRTGSVVQGFDVSVTNHKNVVLFVVDEATNDQTLYLTSPAGTLRKMVTVKAGVGAEARIADKDKKAFEKEKQFWIARLAPAPAAK